MTGPEVRAQLAAVITGVVPPEWTVYPGVPEQASFPAVVIQTDTKRVGTFCAEIHRMTVHHLEARSTGIAGYDAAEVMAATVLDALSEVEGLAYDSTENRPEILGGVEAHGSILTIEMYVN